MGGWPLLGLVALYYALQMPYTKQVMTSLLFMQCEIINDALHADDLPLLDKARKALREFCSTSSVDFDSE